MSGFYENMILCVHNECLDSPSVISKGSVDPVTLELYH